MAVKRRETRTTPDRRPQLGPGGSRARILQVMRDKPGAQPLAGFPPVTRQRGCAAPARVWAGGSDPHHARRQADGAAVSADRVQTVTLGRRWFGEWRGQAGTAEPGARLAGDSRQPLRPGARRVTGGARANSGGKVALADIFCTRPAQCRPRVRPGRVQSTSRHALTCPSKRITQTRMDSGLPARCPV